jgi:transcriptional regulator GlxA family with amidase domain
MKRITVLAIGVLAITGVLAPVVLAEEESGEKKQMTLGVLLYEDFEILDVFGPVEMFGSVGEELKIVMVAEEAGQVKSYQGPKAVADVGFDDCPPLDILLVPGGFGTLPYLQNQKALDWIKDQSTKTQLTTSVCSGSAILAKAGVLDGKKATSNKVYFNQLKMVSQNPNVEWIEEARWVEDGNVVTSSGVSAGMDMALAVIAKIWGEERAEAIAIGTEYEWHRDADVDPFVKYLNQAPALSN